LFGHEKGAFTGAVARRIGKFEEASGGTLLLDEISEMDVRLQSKLLRAIQERVIDRVGGTKPVAVDIRIIATSNRNLADAVKAGSFREDLLYRLNVVNLKIPPLRDRPADVLELADHFVKMYAKANGMVRVLSTEARAQLIANRWPGNVRELENAIERAVVLSRDEDFTEDLLPLSVQMFAQQRRTSLASESIETLTRRLADQAISDYELREGEIYQLVIDQIEHALIDRALARCNGVKTKAADFLGINRNTLNKKVKDLGIEAVD
jgi:DNA-binding NtrC family response regulator